MEYAIRNIFLYNPRTTIVEDIVKTCMIGMFLMFGGAAENHENHENP